MKVYAVLAENIACHILRVYSFWQIAYLIMIEKKRWGQDKMEIRRRWEEEKDKSVNVEYDKHQGWDWCVSILLCFCLIILCINLYKFALLQPPFYLYY